MEEGEGAGVGAAPRLRLSQEQGRALGERLAMAPPDRHVATTTAAALGMTSRWMRTLRQRARKAEAPRPVGRPRTAPSERASVRALVAEQRERQGATTGWRPIYEALCTARPKISRMLVEQELASLKREERTKKQRAIEAARQSVEVLGRDTVWGEDTTHLGRLAPKGECAGELIRDRATTATVSLTVGPPPNAQDILDDLRQAALARGGWPLVLQMDNASIYLSLPVRRELEAQRVIVLRSRVHTPTDNAPTERGHRDFKDETGLGKGVELLSHAEAAARLVPALIRLDRGRLRASRGWHTAAELDRIVPRADACVDRDAFHDRARAAMTAAVLGLEDPDAARRAEREALITTLCEFGLARRHVGRRHRVGTIPMPEPRPTHGAAARNG